MEALQTGQRAIYLDTEPAWNPLLNVVGDVKASQYMFIAKYQLESGPIIHQYKHIELRLSVFLTDKGDAFTICDGLYIEDDAPKVFNRIDLHNANH